MVDSLAGLRAEHASLQEQLSDSAVHTNPGLAKKINRRYAELSAIMGADELVRGLEDDLAAAKELSKEDAAFAEELPILEKQLAEASEKLRRLLIPRDPTRLLRAGKQRFLARRRAIWAELKTFRLQLNQMQLIQRRAYGHT